MNKRLFFTVVIAGSLQSLNVSAASLTGVDLKLISDSNPAKAEFDRDIEATSSIRGRVAGNLFARELSNDEFVSSGFSINASASFEHNADIEGLGESRYRASMDWFRENIQATGAPFLRLGLGTTYLDSQTERRDGILVDVAASINFQPTDFFDTTMGVHLEVRDAETAVFDTTKSTLFATANFSPFSKVVLRTGLRVVFGDEVSSSTPNLNIFNTAEVIEPDEAFGGLSADSFAYLLGATSAIAEVGGGYRIRDNVEANLLYRYVNTEADGGISYDRSMVEFTIGIDL